MDTEQLSMTKKTLVGVQFLFVAFGATVLVPLLIGIDPATALFTAGVGTFLFHFITKGKVPIFLGSSFAFIAPIIAATKQWGLPGTIAGLTSVSLVYFVMSALVKWQGKKLLDRIFPPVVIGPAIILIGLSLSGSAVDMAKTNWILAFTSLITAILVLTFCKGLMKLVPIISGVIVGYVIAICMGEVDFSGVAAASWFSCPVSFDTITHFSWAPFLYMLPVAIAPVLEHIGDVYVVSAVAKKDFVADPGLHRTMLGDGLACLCSAFLGGPPETTYSEVTGAMSITKVTSPAVIRISAATAICFSIVGKLSALLQSIPQVFPDFCLILSLICTEFQIFTDSHILKDLPPFRHKDYTGIHDMERLLSRDGFILEKDLPFREFHEPHDGFHRGGLSCSVRSDKGHDFPFGNREADAFQRRDISIAGDNILKRKQHHSSSFPR